MEGVLCVRCGQMSTMEKTEPAPGVAGRRHRQNFGCRKVTAQKFREMEQQAKAKLVRKANRGVVLEAGFAFFGADTMTGLTLSSGMSVKLPNRDVRVFRTLRRNQEEHPLK